MFEYVHHINYLVWDLDSVEAYFEKYFGLKPLSKSETMDRGSAAVSHSVSYQLGPTVLQFTQPHGMQWSMGFFALRRNGGPVISHIGLMVNNIDERVRELKEAGVDFTQEAPEASPHGGYKVIDIAPEGSCGMRSQSDRWKMNEMDADGYFGVRLQLCENLKNDGSQ